MTDYQSRIASVPEDVIYRAYLHSIIDRLRVVYDPRYDLTQLFIVQEHIPDRFLQGENILEYAENLLLESEDFYGKNKNSEYLSFLAHIVAVIQGDRRNLADFTIPSDGETATPETMGENTYERFPGLHGVPLDDMVVCKYSDGISYPANLNGDAIFTYPKANMASVFDTALNEICGVIKRWTPFYTHYEGEDFYKETAIYPTFKFTTSYYMEGAEPPEPDVRDSTLQNNSMHGTIGYLDGWVHHLDFEVRIHSSLPFPYKFIVLTDTSGNEISREYQPYHFAIGGYSVLYESPEAVTGDAVWNYRFEGEQKDQDWSITFSYPVVVIVPEYPDRLQEYLEN